LELLLPDLRTATISDANADHNDAEHNATLINFAIDFGNVASTEDLVKRLRSAKPTHI
jgi:isochorismate hydrolase